MIASILTWTALIAAAPPTSLLPPDDLREQFRLQLEQRQDHAGRDKKATRAPVSPELLARGFLVRLESSFDGWVRISAPVTASQAQSLRKQGVRELPVDVPVEGEALQGGRFHRVVRAGPSFQDDVGASVIEQWSGREVRVIFGRDAETGQVLLLELRAPEETP